MFGKPNRLVDAAEEGDLNTVIRELTQGADVNSTNFLKVTPLMAAISKNRKDVVQHLLTQDNIDINVVNFLGTNALMVAARLGHIDIVKTLIADKRTDVNKLGKFGGTALMNAAGFGHKEIVEELLKVEGISLAETYTDKKHSPITIARQNGHEKIAVLLENFEATRKAAPAPRIIPIQKPPSM